jgi:hypothetical protein
MKNILAGSLASAIFLCFAYGAPHAAAQPVDDYNSKNDSILLVDGKKLVGRILADLKNEIVMMLNSQHITIPKKDIERIYNRPDREVAFVKLLPGAGHFPPWWVPAYDLFYSDWVRRFEQVPALAVTEGEFARVPYLSFLANKWFELNVYGDPEKPAGIEVGIYGWRRHSTKYQALAREFLTSYLHSISQIRALDELPATGGRTQLDGLFMEITSPSAPDSYGGWWASIWYPQAIAAARIPLSEFDAKTQKMEEVVNAAFSHTKWDKTDVRRMARKLAAKAKPLVYNP